MFTNPMICMNTVLQSSRFYTMMREAGKGEEKKNQKEESNKNSISRKKVRTMGFDTIKLNFERGLWSSAQVKVAVKKGVITPEQYHEITGEKYK